MGSQAWVTYEQRLHEVCKATERDIQQQVAKLVESREAKVAGIKGEEADHNTCKKSSKYNCSHKVDQQEHSSDRDHLSPNNTCERCQSAEPFSSPQLEKGPSWPNAQQIDCASPWEMTELVEASSHSAELLDLCSESASRFTTTSSLDEVRAHSNKYVASQLSEHVISSREYVTSKFSDRVIATLVATETIMPRNTGSISAMKSHDSIESVYPKRTSSMEVIATNSNSPSRHQSSHATTPIPETEKTNNGDVADHMSPLELEVCEDTSTVENIDTLLEVSDEAISQV